MASTVMVSAPTQSQPDGSTSKRRTKTKTATSASGSSTSRKTRAGADTSRKRNENGVEVAATAPTGMLFEPPTAPSQPDVQEAEGKADANIPEDYAGSCVDPPDHTSLPYDSPREKSEKQRQNKRMTDVKKIMSQVNQMAAARFKRLTAFLQALQEKCRLLAAPKPDDDEHELSWRDALKETAARCAVRARDQHMRVLIVLFLLGAGVCATSGVPVFGPSMNFGVWTLQILSVAAIWIGLTVPWARGHSFGSLFQDGALSKSDGERVDMLVPSVALIVFGVVVYVFSAALMGADSNSWTLLKVLTFYAVSGLATATAAYETAAISQSANRPNAEKII